MKIKTLAVIGLLALAPVHSTELNAASNTTVKVAKDDSGKVDYKNFYKNGKRVKYEDWNKGKKVKVTNYKNGKVTSKAFYTDGVRTTYEKWDNGVKKYFVKNYSNGGRAKYYLNDNRSVRKLQAISSNNKVVYTEYYEYKNGRRVKGTQYRDGKLVSKQYYYKDGLVKHEDYNTKNGKSYITQTIVFDKNDNVISRK